MSILSIQSHVSFGHVGNAASVFILQRMGQDVWPVHTVLFSNHPGYGAFRGQVVDSSQIADIITGIEERGVFPSCQAVLGGYIGSAATGDVLVEAVRRVKQANPDSLFFCDPVMGDRDKGLYVPDDIVQFYREQGGLAADILKPNAFELEVLTGQPVKNIEQAVAAATTLIDRWNLRAVVVSSVAVSTHDNAATPEQDNAPAIACVAVMAAQAWVVETPLLPIEQKGAGDAFMALFVANFLQSLGDVPNSLGSAASSIWSIMNKSLPTAEQELLLVQAQDVFVCPSCIFQVREVNK